MSRGFTRFAAPLLMAVGALGSHNVYAFPCQYGFVTGESGNYNCTDGTSNSDWDNLDGQTIFGSSDWTAIEKIDADGTSDTKVDYGFDITVDSSRYFGTWSFSATLWDNFSEAVIVIKDGATGKQLPEDVQWSAYSVISPDNGISNDLLLDIVGQWDMGTECLTTTTCANSFPRQVSHISLYARGTPPAGDDDDTEPPAAVPEPSTLALFGISLLGVGLTGLRRRRSRGA